MFSTLDNPRDLNPNQPLYARDQTGTHLCKSQKGNFHTYVGNSAELLNQPDIQIVL